MKIIRQELIKKTKYLEKEMFLQLAIRKKVKRKKVLGILSDTVL